jgi:hypothetical protein
MARKQHLYGSTDDDIAIRDDEYFGSLLNEALPDTTDYRIWECFGFIRNGQPSFAWSYHSYLGCGSNQRRWYEAELSVASFSERWATKSKIKQMLSLFFNRSCYNRLTVLIRPSNRQAVKFSNLAGFTLEGTIRQPAGEEEILQFSLLREDWQQGKFYELYR